MIFYDLVVSKNAVRTNYDYSLWFCNINIDKSSLNEENSFIITIDQNVID